MATSTEVDIPPIRIAYSGVRLALAVALVPLAILLMFIGVSIAWAGGWCGVPSLLSAIALLCASVGVGAIVGPCIVVLICGMRRQAHPVSSLQWKLLAISVAGILVAPLLTWTAYSAPSGRCATPELNRAPIASASASSLLSTHGALTT